MSATGIRLFLGPSQLRGLGLLLLIGLLARAGIVVAQAEALKAEGLTIHGQVTDLATGQAIAGARLAAGGRVERSGPDGRFQLELPPGRYHLRAEAAGYGSSTLVDLPGSAATLGERELNPALPPIDADRMTMRAVADKLRAAAELSADLKGLEGEDLNTDGGAETAAAEGSVRIQSLDRQTTVPAVIRVQMEDGSIVAMSLESYLRGVVPAEMGYLFRRSFAALEAQAIASRTYAATRCLPASAGDPARCEPGLDANVDTTTRTQVWRPVYYDISDAAVAATRGQVARADGALVDTLYFARTVDRTLSSEDSRCCAGRPWPHLRSVGSPDAFDEARGHGAGMSQEGAAVLADWGATSAEIIGHYYSGVQVDPQRQPRLYDAGVEPRAGRSDEPFRFSLSYMDPDGDPPQLQDLEIDGERFEMQGPDGGEFDYRSGVRFSLERKLAAGEHRLRFVFADGFTEPVEMDAGSILVQPVADLESATETDAASEADVASEADAVSEAESEADETLATEASDGVFAASAELEGADLEAIDLSDSAEDDGSEDAEGGIATPEWLRSSSLDPAAALDPAPSPDALGPVEPADPLSDPLAAADPPAEADPATAAEPEEQDATVSALLLEGPEVEAEFAFMAVAAHWSGQLPEGAEVELALRTSRDGATWSEWTPLLDEAEDTKVVPDAPDAAESEGWTRLLVARGQFLQARALVQGSDEMPTADALDRIELHYFNSDVGPSAPTAPLRSMAVTAGPQVVSRAAWGADESKRRNAAGAEIWPPFYTQPRAQIVHHTVTNNDPADPAAIVRSIYHYHAITRGWGDIGYNFLIDHRGNVYEGRFGGERDGRISQGGHARQYNSNSIGVALLGTYTDAGARPAAAMEKSLVELLSFKGKAYSIDPMAPVTLAGTRFAYAVMGHRDALPGHTQCPGDGVYGRLSSIRTGVRARMAELGSGGGVATPAPTPTPRPLPSATAPPPAPTPAPGNCGEQVAGGSFEAEEARWALSRAYYSAWDVYRGQRAVFVGLRDEDSDRSQSYASAQQSLRLPAQIGSAVLSFAAKTRGDAADIRLLRVLGPSGAVIALGSERLPAASEWTGYRYDLSAALKPLAGQEIRLYFGVINNGDGKRSYLRLDDVSLQICGLAGTGAPATQSPAATAAAASATPPSATETPVPRATATAVELPYPGPPYVTVTPGPVIWPGPDCSSILDSDFDLDAESGALPDAWQASGDHPALRLTAPVFAGEGALRLGPEPDSVDRFGYAAAARMVEMPAGTISATLSMHMAFAGRAPEDAVLIELRRPSTGERQILLGPNLGPGSSAESGAAAWTGYRLSLDRRWLSGQVQVYLAVLNRGQDLAPGDQTRAIFDELKLEACRLPGRAWLPFSHKP